MTVEQPYCLGMAPGQSSCRPRMSREYSRPTFIQTVDTRNCCTYPREYPSATMLLQAEKAFIQMDGNAVFRRAVAALGSIARETLAANDVDKSDIDWLVPHQANLRIIAAAAKKLDLSMDKRGGHGRRAREHVQRLGAAGARCRCHATDESTRTVVVD